MPEKTSTIYDVAEAAGISIATVSRVLNKPDKVSPKTKEKVYSVMQELNFTPKADARARAKRETGRIGVITLDLEYPSFIHRLRGISRITDDSSYELVIITLRSISDIDHYLRSANLTDRLDGIIIISHKMNNTTLKILNELKIKAVFIEFGEDEFTSVTVDNLRGGEMAAEYLISKGCKTFAVLTESEDYSIVHPNRLRVEGFKSYLKSNNLTRPPIYYGNDMENSIESALGILTTSPLPDALFATTDMLAVAVIKAAKKVGITIPDEISLIGFDGINISEHMDITTIDQSLEESGKIAAEQLLKIMKEPRASVTKTVLPLKVIERMTVK